MLVVAGWVLCCLEVPLLSASVGVVSPEALRAPLEGWQRVVGRFQGWCVAHAGWVRWVRRVVWVATAVAVVLLLVAVLVVPRFGLALVPGLVLTADLVVVVCLARTRTIPWRVVATFFGLGVPWAFGVAFFTVWVASWSGLGVGDDGTMVSLAGFVEESGKLVPLVLVVLLAPGRVRRFAAVDWALVGFAVGAGFLVAEDGVRRLQRVGLLAQLLGVEYLPYSLNPWASGMFVSGDDLAVAVGHQVATMNIAMGIGLGIGLWRSRLWGHRLWAWLLPVVLAAWAVCDHAAYNAHVTSSSWPASGGEGFPGWMWLVWLIGGYGRFAVPLSVCLFVVCLLVDARRRVRADWFGYTTADASPPWQPALTGWPSLVRVPVLAGCALVSFTASDLAVGVAAHHKSADISRVRALTNGQAAAGLIRAARADAMAVTTPGAEPATRHRFRWYALLIGVLGLAACLGYGSLVAQQIGHYLGAAGDQPFFAGLLEGLGRWWDSIGPGGQMLVTAGVVALVVASGGSLGLAFGVAGIATWTAAHGKGLADLTRNPQQAINTYLKTATPGQIALDALDFTLTFIPSALIGKLAGNAARQGGSRFLNKMREWWKAKRAAKTAKAAEQAAEAAEALRKAQQATRAAENAALREKLGLPPRDPGLSYLDDPGPLVPAPVKSDPAARALSRRIQGQPQVAFANDPILREVDSISDIYVAQSKPGSIPLGKAFRDQAKATFEIALATKRVPYFHFEGAPHRDVIRKLAEYGKRYGITPVIDTKPLGV